MDVLAFSLGFTAAAFLIALIFTPFDKRLTIAAGALFALYIGLDDLATTLPRLAPAFGWLGGRWNWEGKLYSIALAVTVIAAMRCRPKDIGLTLVQRNLRTSLIATGVLVSLSCGLGFVFRPGLPNAETIAFQLLMPGIAEELAYRGVAPAILLGLVHRRGMPGKTPWAVVLITALVFGLWHGLGYSAGAFSFDGLAASFPFIGGIAYGWLRFHSGSLLLPILAHGLGNTIFYLSALILPA